MFTRLHESESELDNLPGGGLGAAGTLGHVGLGDVGVVGTTPLLATLPSSLNCFYSHV